MIERFADPEGMESLLNEIQMSGERDMEMIQRAGQAEATSGALDTSKLGLEVGGDTARVFVDLDGGHVTAKNDGDGTAYIYKGDKTVPYKTDAAAYPLPGHPAGHQEFHRMDIDQHRGMDVRFMQEMMKGNYYRNQRDPYAQ